MSSILKPNSSIYETVRLLYIIWYIRNTVSALWSRSPQHTVSIQAVWFNVFIEMASKKPTFAYWKIRGVCIILHLYNSLLHVSITLHWQKKYFFISTRQVYIIYLEYTGYMHVLIQMSRSSFCIIAHHLKRCTMQAQHGRLYWSYLVKLVM